MNAIKIVNHLLEATDPDDPQAVVARFVQQQAREQRAALASAIDRAVASFEYLAARNGVATVRQADQLAAEMASEFAERLGYGNGSDEFDLIVSAVNARASELFPDEAA